jgi:fatty acid desaturase
VHLQHHAKHGTAEDTERTYFEGLSWRFLCRAGVGLHALAVRAGRRRAMGALAFQAMPIATLALHGAVVAGMVAQGWVVAAVAWVIGVGVVFPLLGAIRQLLEHRGPDARCDVDYASQAHGPYTRVFAGSPLAGLVGGAGFDRHLLHHWDMRIPCGRLADVERLIEGSELGAFYAARRTSYARAFRDLFGR